MIKADLSDVRKLEQDLKNLSERAWPYANRFALNGMAFDARKNYQQEIRDNLTLRNKWTVGSVRVAMARGTDPHRQFAVTGSTEEYMADQEFGATQRATGSTGKPIPTSRAASQPRGTKRTRVPSRRNRMSRITLAGHKITPKTPAQRLVLLVRQAVESGRRHIYLDGDSGPREGIYYVRGGSLKRGRGWPKGAKLDMLWDLSRASIRITPQPLLSTAVDSTMKRGPEIYVDALTQQIKRQRLFRR